MNPPLITETPTGARVPAPAAPTTPARVWEWLTTAGTGRFVGGLALAGAAFALFILLVGRSPLDAYAAMFGGALGDSYGWTEILVKLTPIVLCALAVTIPAKGGLINVGGPGQLWIGAWAATWVALNFGSLPGPVVIPLMMLAGFLGGGVWAGMTALARAVFGLNEVISTLLLNYVAVLFVNIFIYGPWKDPSQSGWPYTAAFSQAARLPSFGDSRVHLGLVIAIVALALAAYGLSRTSWGFKLRAIGGNADAAQRLGLPVTRYLILAMVIGGGLAGLAGMIEVSAIQARLQPGIAPTEGYLGFLASWMALHHPLGALGMSVLLSVIAVGGDSLQLGADLPSAAVNVLIGLILVGVLATRRARPARS